MIIFTTDTKNDAEIIASELIENRLAACVQITQPIQSTYLWRGNVEWSLEFMCFVKTREDLYRKVETLIKEYHPYEVPEIIQIPVQHGYKPYLDWIDTVTTD